MNVLSLFDGISCGQLALIRAGFKDFVYYASEIDKNSIKITQHNFPNTIQLGSVTDVDVSKLKDIGLLIGGSPCVNLSFAGKGKGMVTKENEEIFELKRYLELKSKGCEFEGSSYLFWEYIRILKDIRKYNPDVKFLLENVSMKKKHEEIITNTLGVEPIVINSSLVSAQNRVRLYWTNIPVSELQDKSIFIEDILDSEFDNKYWLKERNTELLLKKVDITNAPNIACIDVYNKKVKLDRKCPTLTLPHHNSIRLLQNGKIRKLTPNECEKLQNVPLNYTDCNLSDIHRYSMLGNGWTVYVIAHIFGGLL